MKKFKYYYYRPQLRHRYVTRIQTRKHEPWKIWLFVVLPILSIIIFITGHGYAKADANMTLAQGYKNDAAQMLASLTASQRDNDALRTKLEASAQIVTPDTTKQIVKAYVAKYFGDETPTALAVFTCESNLNPAALGVNKNGSQDAGVPQINSSNKASFERVTGQNYTIFAHDIETSIKYAKWLKDNSKSGWGNWVCYQIVQGKKA